MVKESAYEPLIECLGGAFKYLKIHPEFHKHMFQTGWFNHQRTDGWNVIPQLNLRFSPNKIDAWGG